jgi:toxin ParE1/3/4
MGKIIILPYAEQDIRDSVIYYAEKEEGFEKQFLSILNQTFQFISTNPFSFPEVKNSIRKFTIKDFPFNVYYIVEDEFIYILAVFHK